ncbi:MAG TPA: 16S rRNA (adenine(1518)-N(6)/adenine(1519)-N(6))-dimethyltransferase RsmA [Bryobacteraceae bacterium]|nr:16S rRNA (adenine(1518)-N(6)/adenine(1519)-N(6))-dimethyltransferase RsmA [Bryobacteraceae bacterium]
MPRKLGQHFLIGQSILEQIAEAACGQHASRVIEIGPGRGALTAHLLPRTDELHAIELDHSLGVYLQQRFALEPKFVAHEADVLETDLSQWGKAVICGNLPYYITSPIIRKFLELDARFGVGVFLLQREVADRLTAKPKTRDYGLLTVMTQLVCEVELVCHVPPSAFSPPPKVESAAVRLLRRSTQIENLAELITFASRCFAQKRKMLRNNLRPFYGTAIDAAPEANLRAEQLDVQAFSNLLTWLKSERSSKLQ